MRILFFLHKIGPYHHARFTELAKNCELIAVEILPDSKEYDWQNIDTGVNYQRVQMKTNAHGQELKGSALLHEIRNLIDWYRPQAIITMGWSNRTYMAALYLAKKEKIPVFSMSDSTYNDVKRYPIMESIKSYIATSFDGFVTAGRRSENYLLKLGVSPEIIFKPFDVVDNSHFQVEGKRMLSFDYDSPYLLCISRYIPKKNLFTLIEAFHHYITLHPEEKTVLYIVGSGPLESALKARISKYTHHQIRLHPFVQYDELPSLYHHARGLILASTSDQWGLVVNEAMAAGLPVMVSNRCGCVDDLVIDGENGWVFEPSLEGIVTTLEKFFAQSPEKLREMGMKGQKIIQAYDLKDYKIAVLSMIDNARKATRKWSRFQKLIVFLRIFLS
ncbi:MAG TPA: glycosyltransferase family 4 protein [Bacteroidales bacterium]|nr:glycosyltransferase family 4 protein [Bacteroidales bacterium]HPO64846.1 glycosyltransferase family 4 protein [Bacteroidales bacterium]